VVGGLGGSELEPGSSGSLEASVVAHASRPSSMGIATSGVIAERSARVA
jgi:hypothetical protein